MLHGLMGGTANWSGILPHLRGNCRAMTVGLPFLAEGSNLESIGDVTDFAARKIDESGVGRMVLMGNSIGGHVAINLLSRYSDRIIGLVLTASSGLFERGLARIGARPPRIWVEEKCREVFYDPKHVTESLVDEVYSMTLNRKVGRMLVKLAKSAKRDNVSPRIKNIQCPTLLIWGRNDHITPPAIGLEFHQQIPNSELVWLDDCGHAPMMEHPEAFAFHLGLWWDKHIHHAAALQSERFAIGGFSLVAAKMDPEMQSKGTGYDPVAMESIGEIQKPLPPGFRK